MKVQVDFDLCESNGLCEAIAPDRFRIDDDDYLQVLDESVTDADVAEVERAVAACPKAAISLSD